MMFSKLKKISTGLLLSSLLLFFLVPVFVHAQEGAQSFSGTGVVYVCDHNGDNGNCNFYDLVAAVQKLVTWGRNFALAFSVVVIAYAGFKYMNSGDNSGERKKANQMLTKTAVGIFLTLLAWLIVTLITRGLGVTATTFLY